MAITPSTFEIPTLYTIIRYYEKIFRNIADLDANSGRVCYNGIANHKAVPGRPP